MTTYRRLLQQLKDTLEELGADENAEVVLVLEQSFPIGLDIDRIGYTPGQDILPGHSDLPEKSQLVISLATNDYPELDYEDILVEGSPLLDRCSECNEDILGRSVDGRCVDCQR